MAKKIDRLSELFGPGLDMNEARRIEREEIDRQLEERMIAAIESMADSLISIANHLSNISEMKLRK